MNNPPRYETLDRTWLLILVIIIIAGLFLRIDTVQHSQVDSPLRADAGEYAAYAYNLGKYRTYSKDIQTAFGDKKNPVPDALRVPGYPFYLSLMTSENINGFIGRIAYSQSIISTLVLLLIAYLSYLCLGKAASLVATALTALSPHLILSNVYILTESLYTFFLLLTLTTFAVAQKYKKLYWWLSGAALLALSNLIRPTTQYYIIILLFWIWLSIEKNNRRQALIAVLSCFILISVIWMIRNLIQIDRVSDPTLSINTLHHGMYPQFMYEANPETYGYPYRYDPQAHTISASVASVLHAISTRFIEQPIEHLTWYLSKPAYFFQWHLIQGVNIYTYPMLTSTFMSGNQPYALISSFMHVLHIPIVIMSILGVITGVIPIKYSRLSDESRKIVLLSGSVYLYFIAIHILAAPFPRYSIPIRPFTYLLALVPLYTIVALIKHRIPTHERCQ